MITLAMSFILILTIIANFVIFVGGLSLLSLIIVKIITKQRIVRKQILSVMTTFAVFVGIFGVIALMGYGEQEISYWVTVSIFLLLVGTGSLVGYITRTPKVR